MRRRDALRSLLLAAAGATLGPGPTGKGPISPGPDTRPGDETNDAIDKLFRALPPGRAHVFVADPSIHPDVVLLPLVDRFRAAGRTVRFESTLQHTDPGDVLVLREPELPARRLAFEVEALDHRARRSSTTVLLSWRMDTPDDALWVTRFAAAAGRVVHVHDVEFDERPEVVPAYYRVPVEVWAGGERVASVSRVETVPSRQ